MKAVLLCAGKSTRTYPLTLTRPKPLLKVANKTILQHNLEQLHATRLIKEVILIVGYKKEMIAFWIKEHQKKFDCVIKTVVQEEQRGTADALQSARSLLGDASFLLMNGDDLFFAEDIKKLLASKSEHALLVHPVAKPEQYGIVLINPRDKKLVKAIVEKPQKPIGNLASTGCYVFSPSIFDIGDVEPSSRGEFELPDLINFHCDRGEVGFVQAKHWFPITYPWDLLPANAYLLSLLKKKIAGKLEKHVTLKSIVVVGKGTLIKSGVYIEGPVLIGEHCTIGPNAYIRPGTTIGNHCKIGHEVEIKNSILFDNTKIPHLNYLGDSVLGEDVNFAAGTITANVRHDKGVIRSSVKKELVETGHEKLGTIIGDHVKLGIKTLIYPGRKIWPNKTTLPGEVVKQDVE